MAESGELQPIIIKRVRGHGGHHGGAWKVAFADFMTAMMAFFLVMWMVGQKQEVRQAVAGYFRDPGAYVSKGGKVMLQGSASVIPSETPRSGTNEAAPNRNGAGPTDAEKSALAQAAEGILSELRRLPEYERLKENVRLQMTAEGLRITLNESEDAPAFFEPGSAKPVAKSATILMTIARQLGQLQNHLVIEGHTDASFGGGKDYTNWELSSDRANAARSLMEVHGLNKGQVTEVRGFADRVPMPGLDRSDGRNRRVTIVVLYRSVESRYNDLKLDDGLLSELDKTPPAEAGADSLRGAEPTH